MPEQLHMLFWSKRGWITWTNVKTTRRILSLICNSFFRSAKPCNEQKWPKAQPASSILLDVSDQATGVESPNLCFLAFLLMDMKQKLASEGTIHYAVWQSCRKVEKSIKLCFQNWWNLLCFPASLLGSVSNIISVTDWRTCSCHIMKASWFEEQCYISDFIFHVSVHHWASCGETAAMQWRAINNEWTQREK